MKKIPTYKVTIGDLDSNLGMTTISLVDEPAVMKNFVCFSEDEKKQIITKFTKDEEKHNITGVAMLADTQIYRYNEEIGSYYIVFPKDVIEEMAIKYSKNGYWNSVNLQHNENNYTDGAIMYEMYIKNSERGIVPTEFSDIPDGSLMVSFHITDDELWDNIKNSGTLNGFSIEVSASMEKFIKQEPKNEIDEFEEFVNEYVD